jgi:hypothetical protein
MAVRVQKEAPFIENVIPLMPLRGVHHRRGERIETTFGHTEDEIKTKCFVDLRNRINAECTRAGKDFLRLENRIAHAILPDHVMKEVVKRYHASGGNLAKAVEVFDNQLEVAIKVVASLIERTDHIAIIAETQYGKTAILCIAIILYNTWQNVNGGKKFCYLVNQNRLSSDEQTRDDFEKFHYLLNPMVYKGVVVGDANANYFNMQERMGRKTNAKRNIESRSNFFKSLAFGVSDLNQYGYDSVIMFIDEGDEALGGKSYFDRTLTSAKRAKVDLRLCLCSATVWDYKDLDGFHKIEAPITEGYSGFVAGRRVPVVDFTAMAGLIGVEGLKNYSMSRDYAKTDILRDVILAFHRGINPNATTDMIVCYPEEDRMKDRFHREPVKAKDLGFNGYPWNNNCFGPSGGMMRFGNKAQLTRFMDEQKYNLAAEGVVLLPFLGTAGECKFTMVDKKTGKPSDHTIPMDIKNKKNRTVIGMIEAAIEYGVQNYVVCVVDRARRADRFPPDCTCFMDMSEKPTTMTAIEQGTLGRASGWFKITNMRSTMVMMAEDVVKVIVETRALYDLYGQKIPVIRPSQHSIKAWRRPGVRTSALVGVRNGDMWKRFSPKLKQSLLSIEKLLLGVDPKGNRLINFQAEPEKNFNSPKQVAVCRSASQRKTWRWHPRNAGFLRDFTGNSGWTYYDVFSRLDEADMDELDGHFSDLWGSEARLLRPNEISTNGHRYASVNNTFVKIGLRNTSGQTGIGLTKLGAIGVRQGRASNINHTRQEGKKNGDIIDLIALMSDNSRATPRATGDEKLDYLSFPLKTVAFDMKGVSSETRSRTMPKSSTGIAKHCASRGNKREIAEMEATTSKRKAKVK